MAIIPNVKLNISYLLGSGTPKFVFTDVTSYAPYTGIIGTISMTSPSGAVSEEPITVLNNASTDRINSDMNIPLLVDGTPEIGVYSFSYSVEDGFATPNTGSYSKTFDFQYVKPKVGITAVVDCLSPYLYTEDTTNYLVGSVSPSDSYSLSSAFSSTDDTVNYFKIPGEKSAFVRPGDKFTITPSTNPNAGEYTVSSVSYDRISDTTIINVSDVIVTEVSPSGVRFTTRVASIFFPQVLGLDPKIGHTKKLGTSVFYDKNHEFSYVTKGLYSYGDGLSIIDYFEDSTDLDIKCDVRLCEVFCCINSVFNEYLGLRCRNKTLADIALEKYILATSHLSSLRQAFECGQSAAVDLLVSEIKKVANCNDDCSCSDTSPTLITGLGGSSSTTVVASSGNGINVSPSVSGDETTYYLSLDNDIIEDIAAGLVGQTLISSNSTANITPTTTGFNITIPPFPSGEKATEFISFNAVADNTSSPESFEVDNISFQNVDNLLRTDHDVKLDDKNPSVNPSHIQAYKIYGFQIAPNSDYKAFISVTSVVGSEVGGVVESSVNYDGIGLLTYTVVITEKLAGEFSFILLQNGLPLNKAQKLGKVFKFNIQIIQ